MNDFDINVIWILIKDKNKNKQIKKPMKFSYKSAKMHFSASNPLEEGLIQRMKMHDLICAYKGANISFCKEIQS